MYSFISFSLLLISLLRNGHAIISDGFYNSNQKYISLTTFGFLQEGTIDIVLQQNGEPNTGSEYQWLVACSQEDYASLFMFGDGCSLITNTSCLISVHLSGSINITNLIVPKYGVYFFDIFNCARQKFDARIWVRLMNPGGEQLSFGLIPLTTMYMLLLGIWIMTTIIWCYNWIKYRTQPKKLQVLFTLYPISKCMVAISGIYYWYNASQTGNSPLSTLLPYGLLYIAEEAVLYTLLLLIASGWGISKDKLGIEKFIIGVVIVFLIGTRLLGFTLHNLFYLLAFIVYVIIIVILFKFNNQAIMDISVEIRNNPDIDNADEPGRRLLSSRSKLINFKMLMLAYIFALMLVTLLELLFLQNYTWISEMLKELLEVQGIICLGLILKLRPTTAYYPLEDENEHPAYFRQPVELQQQ